MFFKTNTVKAWVWSILMNHHLTDYTSVKFKTYLLKSTCFPLFLSLLFSRYFFSFSLSSPGFPYLQVCADTCFTQNTTIYSANSTQNNCTYYKKVGKFEFIFALNYSSGMCSIIMLICWTNKEASPKHLECNIGKVANAKIK